MHSIGILHRDLKLENIMMSGSDSLSVPKIVDFGLSTVLLENDTINGDFLGTIGYCPPEMITRQSYNFKADVWSLGIILYRLLSGTAPFPGNEAL
jgi:serine/threonine protein kinase